LTARETNDAPRTRVLTLIDKPIAIGGAERLAVDLSIGLDPERFDRYFYATRTSPLPQLDDELRVGGVDFRSLRRRSRFDLFAWRSLVRFLRREQIDVVHAHLFGSNFWASVLGRFFGVPVVVAHEHTWSYVGHPLRRFADRHVIARFADTIIAVSQADADKMVRIEGIPAEKITVIRNGIHEPRPDTDPERVRSEIGIGSDAFVVASVAVIRPQKRLDRLIEAAVTLREDVPGIQILIVGAGYAEETAKLEALVADRGVGDTISFLGARMDAPNVMAAADIGIICSDYEGIPLSLLEFMALERPVVATAVGGIPEVLQDGETGMLVHDLSAEALATAVVAMSRLPRSSRRTMGVAARKLQQEHYSFDAYVATVASLYDSLLTRSR
jgi:glycosyltransferase involved in cell wall biosynthesis